MAATAPRSSSRLGFDRLPSSPGDVTDFVTRNTTFEDLASMRAERVNLTGGGEPERLGGVRVSRNFFDTLGVAADARPQLRRSRRDCRTASS